MSLETASVRVLARRLLAAERASEPHGVAEVHEAVRLCEKLRISLTRFAGTDGFVALQRRALSLAQREVPALNAVKVTAQGDLDGFEGFVARSEDLGSKGAIALSTHLLGLLVSFVGEPITLRLVRDAWPDARLEAE